MGNTTQLNDYHDVIEIVDLISTTSTCQSLSSFVPQTIGSIGGLGLDSIIFIKIFHLLLFRRHLNKTIIFLVAFMIRRFMIPHDGFLTNSIIKNNYSQTCVKNPPLGPKNSSLKLFEGGHLHRLDCSFKTLIR
jgi:hypothetical protein